MWNTALKQCDLDFIIRNTRDRPALNNNSFKVKIGLSTKHCILVDLAGFQAWQEVDDDE